MKGTFHLQFERFVSDVGVANLYTLNPTPYTLD